MNPRAVLQLGSADEALRTRVWNVLSDRYRYSESTDRYLAHVWQNVLNLPVESATWETYRLKIFKSDWLAFYDIVEDVASDWILRNDLAAALELGGSGYRFVDDQLVPITDETQLAEIEKAQAATNAQPLVTVRKHLDAALAHYANRDQPDYRNSIKESITALEALVNIINGKTGGKTGKTLGDALKELNGMGGTIHKAMIGGLSALYGWTSDSGGIRHYMKDDGSAPGADEARFMLVTCSALVNFLVAKAATAGINVTT